jgi:ABC-2 type transport system permease protein
LRRGRELGVLFWKEMLDLRRDRKTLFTSILLPLVSLPLIGLMGLALVAEQPVHVAIIDLDNTTSRNNILNITVSSAWLSHNASRIMKSMGFNVSFYTSPSVLGNPSIDVALIIPKGFSRNASSLNTTARVKIIRRAGVQAAARAESTLYGIVSVFSQNISNLKLRALTRLLHINATIPALRNPVTARTEIISIKGKPVSREVELRNAFARILVLAFSFVVTPAAGYVIDGIIGERERKTIELLLASPASPQIIVYAKLLAATILGLITALADILGLVVYMGSISIAAGASFGVVVDPFLLVLHSATAFFTILVTISIALPFITRTKGIRSASNIMSLITIVALVFFFTGFFVDYIRLSPEVLYPLYLVPYTHSILVIQSYILGYPLRASLHLLVLALASIVLLYLASKTVNTEKLLIAKS